MSWWINNIDCSWYIHSVVLILTSKYENGYLEIGYYENYLFTMFGFQKFDNVLWFGSIGNDFWDLKHDDSVTFGGILNKLKHIIRFYRFGSISFDFNDLKTICNILKTQNVCE